MEILISNKFYWKYWKWKDQKRKIKNHIDDLTNTDTYKLDLMNIYRTLHPRNRICTRFITHGIFANIEQILDPKEA